MRTGDTSAQAIADQSMDLATEFLASTRDRMLEMAGGDMELLQQAADIVRGRATGGPALSHSAEHLAFSMITAAHKVLLDRSQLPRDLAK